MDYIVNGDKISSEHNVLEAFLTDLNIPKSGIAIAVNEVVISKTKWSHYTLKENDKILIITATQGG